jgi:hypothetical protein
MKQQARMKTLLISHDGALLDQEGLRRWLERVIVGPRADPTAASGFLRSTAQTMTQRMFAEPLEDEGQGARTR